MIGEEIDLVCWDFGDTLVDETFMQYAPDGVPEWPEAYRTAFKADPDFVDRLNLGEASLHDLLDPLAGLVPMSRAEIARHLRSVFTRIEWLPGMRELVTELNGRVLQAIVTVNPHEFAAMAVACGLDPLVDVIVTSADAVSLSKPVMARRARHLLGLSPALSTTLLVDNNEFNVHDFLGEGGLAIHYTPESFPAEWDAATGSSMPHV
jgi:beta-phosphoglucomutase-like phosphatase (HAD superfamily)